MGHVTLKGMGHVTLKGMLCIGGSLPRLFVRHVTHINESCHTLRIYESVAHIFVRHVTHMNESCHTYE